MTGFDERGAYRLWWLHLVEFKLKIDPAEKDFQWEKLLHKEYYQVK